MAYATLSQVKDYLGIPTADTSRDDLLSFLLDRASDLIDKFCQRKFETKTEIRSFKIDQDTQKLFLPDLLSISSLKVNGVNVPLAAFLFCPLDAPSSSEPYRWIESRSGLFRWNQIVEIDGTWGYWGSVPDQINFACLLWTVRLFRKKDQPEGKIASESIGDYSVSFVKDKEAVVEAPKEILEPFKKKELLSF